MHNAIRAPTVQTTQVRRAWNENLGFVRFVMPGNDLISLLLLVTLTSYSHKVHVKRN